MCFFLAEPETNNNNFQFNIGTPYVTLFLKGGKFVSPQKALSSANDNTCHLFLLQWQFLWEVTSQRLVCITCCLLNLRENTLLQKTTLISVSSIKKKKNLMQWPARIFIIFYYAITSSYFKPGQCRTNICKGKKETTISSACWECGTGADGSCLFQTLCSSFIVCLLVINI